MGKLLIYIIKLRELLKSSLSPHIRSNATFGGVSSHVIEERR